MQALDLHNRDLAHYNIAMAKALETHQRRDPRFYINPKSAVQDLKAHITNFRNRNQALKTLFKSNKSGFLHGRT